MRQLDPIDIRPMRIRGVLGISRKIYFRNFWPLFLYTLVMVGLVMLISSVLLVPSFGNSLKNANYGILNEGQGILELPDLRDYRNELIIGSRILPVLYAIIGGLVLTALLSFLEKLLLRPMYEGNIAMEVKQRFGGVQSGATELFKRSGLAFKNFFVTNLCTMVSKMAANFVLGLILVAVILLFSVPLAMTAAVGGKIIAPVILLCLFILLVAAVFCIAMLLFAFVNPVVANEDIKYFQAIGRSFKLIFKKPGRVIGVYLLVGLIYLGIFIGISVIGYLINRGAGNTGITVFLTMLLTLIFAPYFEIIKSVLYYDIRVREEGNGWIGGNKAGGEPQQTETAEPAAQTPAAVPEDYENPDQQDPNY